MENRPIDWRNPAKLAADSAIFPAPQNTSLQEDVARHPGQSEAKRQESPDGNALPHMQPDASLSNVD